MKLLEIAPNFVMGQTGTLMTILQHLESKLGRGAKIPLNAVANLMRNVGYSMSYDDFKNMYDSDENLKNVVGNFNQNEITLGKADDIGDGEEAGDEQTVDQMAQTAAKANINQPAVQ